MDLHAHLPLARKAAATATRRYPLRYDDAYADALVGLWKACRDWQPDGGSRFDRYAWERMRGEILEGVRRASPLTRGQVKRRVPPQRSLDADPTLTADLTCDPFADWWERQEHDDTLDEVLGQVTGRHADRDRAIIARHCDGELLRDLAAEYGMTESRACQIWRKWTRRYQEAA